MRMIAGFSVALALVVIAVCAGHLSASSDPSEQRPPLSSFVDTPPPAFGSRALPGPNRQQTEYIQLATEHAELLSKLASEEEYAKAVEDLKAKVDEAKAQLKAKEETAEKRLSEIKESLRQLVADSANTQTREKAQRALQVLEQPSVAPPSLPQTGRTSGRVTIPARVTIPNAIAPRPTLAPPRD